jgi:protein phosphatase
MDEEPIGRTPPSGVPNSGTGIKLDVAAMTDVGAVRDNNEDAYLIWDLDHTRQVESRYVSQNGRPAVLLAVSDGMGGPSAGEIASRVALEALESHATIGLPPLGPSDPDTLKAWLASGVREANQRVYDESHVDSARKGMGATLSVAVILDSTLNVAHVGDSRVYLQRGDRLLQLTMDQTHVQQLVSYGQITAEQARIHNERNLLLQAIGTSGSVEIDELDVAIQPGDRILLCSDGLHGLVDDESISATLSSGSPPAEQCTWLVNMANRLGGHDNITVVVAHVA